MRQNLESWLLALVEHKGCGRVSVPGGRAIIAGAARVAPFEGDYPTVDHERLLDAKIAIVHLVRAGYLRPVERGEFEITELGLQRAAIEHGSVDLRVFPA